MDEIGVSYKMLFKIVKSGIKEEFVCSFKEFFLAYHSNSGYRLNQLII